MGRDGAGMSPTSSSSSWDRRGVEGIGGEWRGVEGGGGRWRGTTEQEGHSTAVASTEEGRGTTGEAASAVVAGCAGFQRAGWKALAAKGDGVEFSSRASTVSTAPFGGWRRASHPEEKVFPWRGMARDGEGWARDGRSRRYPPCQSRAGGTSGVPHPHRRAVVWFSPTLLQHPIAQRTHYPR